MIRMPMPRRRPGFTLIELLVVIAIIAILVSLLGAGIFYAYTRMYDTGSVNDVRGLNAALQAFKAKYGFYPPDQFQLNSNYAAYKFGNGLDQASLNVINKMWPAIGQFSGIKWDGVNNNISETLDGDQSMVFFLAGIPPQAGFSIDQHNPASVGGTRVGPLFNFNFGRLFDPRNKGTAFLSYKDYYSQQPYLYFSNNGRKNGYNAGYSITTTGGKVAPYVLPSGQFLNPDSCQVICAGNDGKFGPGGSWSPATAATVPADERDDLSNFYELRLGVPQ